MTSAWTHIKNPISWMIGAVFRWAIANNCLYVWWFILKYNATHNGELFMIDPKLCTVEQLIHEWIGTILMFLSSHWSKFWNVWAWWRIEHFGEQNCFQLNFHHFKNDRIEQFQFQFMFQSVNRLESIYTQVDNCLNNEIKSLAHKAL